LLGHKIIWFPPVIALLFASSGYVGRGKTGEAFDKEKKGYEADVSIAITYDNNPYDPRLRTAWGFSCVVRLREKAILFDTGGDGSILLRNMEKLGIDPKEIHIVVLSHIHGDHVGGLASFLQCNKEVTVYVPISFPRRFKEDVRFFSARLREVYKPEELYKGVFTTGELGVGIREQSLLVRTPQGLVVITGCAHPGIVNIVQKAKDIGKTRVHLVMGGFHLGGASASKIESIIENFVEMEVEKVALCHCSGDQARSLFRKRFGLNYIECGVGKKIRILRQRS
jgi:7,8-dihydropterin-6-yl-methyl-4-(beta-D-ribofuranosyl)aminobenzene 5'-phosphate synthase